LIDNPARLPHATPAESIVYTVTVDDDDTIQARHPNVEKP